MYRAANPPPDPIDEEPVESAPLREHPVARPIGADPAPMVAPYDPRPERMTWFVLGVVDVLIALRFVFRFLGASQDSSFVAFIYSLTEPLIAPFSGIFRSFAANGNVFEPESLVAMIVYALIAWGVVALIRIISAPRRRVV